MSDSGDAAPDEDVGVRDGDNGSNPTRTLTIGVIGFVAFMILLRIVNPTLSAVFVNNIPYIVLIIVILYAFTVVFVKQYGATERGIIYRFGKFSRVAGPGWSIVIPFFESEFKKVDVRTRTESIFGVEAVTRDDIPLSFDVTFFYAIADPKKATLQVTAIGNTIKSYFQGLIRDGVGNFVMREVFSNDTDIDAAMKDKAISVLEQWGIIINDIQILKVKLPETLFNALSAPVTEEQKALAARFQAEATRVTTEVLGDSAQRLNPNALTYLYLKALEKIGSAENSKVVLPASFPNVMGGLTTGVGLGIGMESMDEKKLVDQIAQKIGQTKG